MKTNTILLVAFLAIIMLAMGYCGWQHDNKRKAEIAALTARTTKAETTLKDVQGLKAKLESDLNDLQAKYSALAAENEALQGSVEDAQAEIKRRKSAIYRLTKASKEKDGELASLRSQIEGLVNARTQLESDISNLRQENAQLKEENAKLTADLATSREEKAQLARLNETMQADIANLTLKNFKASGFTVEVEKRNGKPTTWKAFAKRVKVGFDLVDVPEKYQGVKKVYLVITDDTGVPLKKTSPISAKINVNGQEQNIIAVSEQNVDIQESQRLSFTHKLEEKLKAGFYRASVYTDLGLLGTSSFRMR
jgi:DNA repair ATPase RecN